MKFSLCNEMFEKRDLAEVCATARDLGYHGIEIAPFTLAKSVTDVSQKQRTQVRRTVEEYGLEVVGLHWLFLGSKGLHMTTTDDVAWRRTVDYMGALIDLCAGLGGKVMVLGSPKQRSLVKGQTLEGAWKQAVYFMQAVLDTAAESNVTICIEPLSPVETNFINTVAESIRLVKQLDHPNLKVTLDVKSMCSEPTPVSDIIRSVHAEDVGHIHVNDVNLYGPGMGDVDYGPIATALRDIGWDKWVSVEVFKYDPDPETIARRSIEYLRGHFS